MIVLDCTIRDGGYQNKWNFDIELVNEYLKACEKSKLNAVEIGFRGPKKIGLFSDVSDKFIENNLYIPNIEFFGVMINASEIVDVREFFI